MRVIIRKSYYRKPYVRADGTRVRGSIVASKKVVEPALPKTRNRVIPKLKKGTLTQHGYSSSSETSTRHRSLGRAVKHYGALSVSKKLNAVATLTKRTSPEKSAVFKADRKWVAGKYLSRRAPRTRK